MHRDIIVGFQGAPLLESTSISLYWSLNRRIVSWIAEGASLPHLTIR